MKKNTDADTGVTDTDWYCVIGSIYFGHGDIDEHGDHGNAIMSAYTYKKTGHWWIRADFKSEINHEDHTIGIVCFRSGIAFMNANGWF